MATPIFYVYQHLDEEGTPFYIGKGSKDRINESHLPWSPARREAQMKKQNKEGSVV